MKGLAISFCRILSELKQSSLSVLFRTTFIFWKKKAGETKPKRVPNNFLALTHTLFQSDPLFLFHSNDNFP